MRSVFAILIIVLSCWAALSMRELLYIPPGNPAPASHFKLPPLPVGIGGSLQDPKPMLHI